MKRNTIISLPFIYLFEVITSTRVMCLVGIDPAGKVADSGVD